MLPPPRSWLERIFDVGRVSISSAIGHFPAMEDAELVDLPGFLDAHPGVRRLYFNGGMSATLFRRRMQPLLLERPLSLVTLPSTSPAHAGLPFAGKLARWRQLLD